jgi:hypothetical protein
MGDQTMNNFMQDVGEVIQHVVMLCFVLTLLSVVIAINYLMWKTIFTSDFYQLKSIQYEVSNQEVRIRKLESNEESLEVEP